MTIKHKRYCKSNYLITIKDDNTNNHLIYHSLYNNARVLNNNLISFLNLFNNPISKTDILKMCEGEIENVLNEFLAVSFIVEENTDERHLIKQFHKPFIENIKKGSTIENLTLAISDACNLGCSHCMLFVNNHIEKRTSLFFNMSTETAKKSIDTFIEQIKVNVVRVHFGNGEPLLNWKTLKFCLEYCSTKKNIQFIFTINTNLTLLTEEIAIILKKYNVKIATSLDGLKKGNDSIRVDLQGKGTFKKIINKIEYLRQIEYPIIGFSITATSHNFEDIGIEIIDLAKSLGVYDISMDFDLVNTTTISVEKLVNKILEMNSYAIKQGIIFHGNWLTPYRAIMVESLLTKGYSFCHAMEGKTLSFGSEGSIKTCGYSNTKVGEIENFSKLFVDSSKYITLLNNRLPGNNLLCKGCIIEGGCAGQCQVSIESGINNIHLIRKMCDFMKLITIEQLRLYLLEQNELFNNNEI